MIKVPKYYINKETIQNKNGQDRVNVSYKRERDQSRDKPYFSKQDKFKEFSLDKSMKQNDNSHLKSS